MSVRKTGWETVLTAMRSGCPPPEFTARLPLDDEPTECSGHLTNDIDDLSGRLLTGRDLLKEESR